MLTVDGVSRVNSTVGEWFEVISGVQQGCLLSPLLFAVTVVCSGPMQLHSEESQ